jgi:hypothetical protein
LGADSVIASSCFELLADRIVARYTHLNRRHVLFGVLMDLGIGSLLVFESQRACRTQSVKTHLLGGIVLFLNTSFDRQSLEQMTVN